MIELTKRQFVRLAGLSIADRIFPRWLRAEPAPRSQNKVIIVTFGGGVRNSETFAPEGVRNIPHLLALKPEGYFYRSCVNSGVLSHFNSTASIVTGNWQRVDDFGFQQPASPTLFELYRKQRSASALDAWAIATNKSFATMGSSSDTGFGDRFGGNVVLPKQLLLEAVEGAIRKGSEGGVANRDLVLEHLENVLNEGYEGVGWTIFKAGRELDRKVRATLLRGLVDYIHGPEAPTSGDELTFFITREVMREFAPRLLLVNFWDMDVAHWGSYSLYLQAITKTDRLCGMLWDEVQENPRYRGKTTVLILPELGRDGDVNTANGFLNHRSGDTSCRNVWLLALGAGVPKGETERTVQHVDIATTAAELLGAKCDGAGRALKELSL
ncbi:MAG: hypothetical protein DMG57_02995 [Acidobacteria bacterium]|nr:MAG: hypothetical protein DMG57_02995 [Acidobacteriota bacterium]